MLCLEVSLEVMSDSKTFVSMTVFSASCYLSVVLPCGPILALNKDSLCRVLWQTPNFMPVENQFGPDICIGDAKQTNIPKKVLNKCLFCSVNVLHRHKVQTMPKQGNIFRIVVVIKFGKIGKKTK